VTGNDNTDKATVSFADHTYAVRGEPGGNEVLVGDHGSGCAHDAKANAVSRRGPIDSIRTSLGGGDDALTLDLGVPPSVPTSIDGGEVPARSTVATISRPTASKAAAGTTPSTAWVTSTAATVAPPPTSSPTASTPTGARVTAPTMRAERRARGLLSAAAEGWGVPGWP
jgi:hypothetical protein